MQLDLEELWPSAASLVGMQFASEAEYEQCKALLDRNLEVFRALYPKLLVIAIPKADAGLVHEARLTYAEIELVDLSQLPPELYMPHMRRVMREGVKRMLAGLDPVP
jgi:hypothetical protein